MVSSYHQLVAFTAMLGGSAVVMHFMRENGHQFGTGKTIVIYNGSGKGEEGGGRESFHTHTLKHVAACLSLGGQQHIGMASGDDMLTCIYILWMLHLAIIVLGHLTLSISV